MREPAVHLDADGAPLQHTRAGSILVFAGQRASRDATRADLQIDAKIAIVWPHDNPPVTQAELANITAHLTQTGSRVGVACDFASR